MEEYRIYRRNPDLVLVDTAVIAKSPHASIAGMGDALAIWFESKACADTGAKNMRGGASTRSALALAELCDKTFPADGEAAIEALHLQVPNDSLERLVEANTLLSGLGFESSGLAAAHAIHNGITTAPGTHSYMHGEKVAFGLIAQLMLESQPKSVVEEVLAFSNSVAFPPHSPTSALAIPAGNSSKRSQGGLPHRERPFTMSRSRTPALVLEAMRAADSAGTSFRQSTPRHARP